MSAARERRLAVCVRRARAAAAFCCVRVCSSLCVHSSSSVCVHSNVCRGTFCFWMA
jgi:hypothetical protein